jgi:preprotein translocase subunit SecD
MVLAACSGHSWPTANGDVLTARVTDQALRPKDVEIARAILRDRFSAVGFSGVDVRYDTGRRFVTIHFPEGEAPTIRDAQVLLHSAELRFRLVLGTIPYSATSAAVTDPSESTCRDGAAVTPDLPQQQVILPDKDKVFCYLLGPTILTGRNIGSANAVVNSSSGTWQVDTTFDNDDFVNKVAKEYVGKQISIVLDGVVQSAPSINQGITGRNVTITGNFSSDDAHELALVLRLGAIPLHLEFVSLKPPG